MSSNEILKKRRKIFDAHLLGFSLGETDQEEVTEKLGKPARKLEEDRAMVLEYDSPLEKSVARWKKLQLIFFDDLLLNVTYSEPELPSFGRDALHAVLGEPDEITDEPEDEDDDDEGTREIFEVELEEEPLLSFVAYFDEKLAVQALSLCADILEDDDEIEDSDEEAIEDVDDGEDEESDPVG